mmetsp:Transcript_93676/g.268091  ORF Transcript_93676/g.268091 Transcript_93676/m.268091 type:complete len:187 (+) Transcript_93676:448-1008(+)
MKESATLALTWVRSNASELNALFRGTTTSPDDGDNPFLAVGERTDLHLHVPAGAVPKDGPSAGVAIVATLVSLLMDVPIPTEFAMTGEITLRGRVMPVGGVRDKVLAAHHANIKHVILPARNKCDIDELAPEVRLGPGAMRFSFASRIWDVLEILFHDKLVVQVPGLDSSRRIAERVVPPHLDSAL